MANNEDQLFREVDEELRREQLKRIWDQYGTYIIGAVAAIVLGVGGVKYWQASAKASAEAAGANFERAIEQVQAKSDEGLKAMQQIAKGDAAGYAALADLALAGEAIKAGRTADAITAYEAIAGKAGLDPVMRDFARLQVASLKIDSTDFTEIQNRLKELSVDSSPWRYSARELTGIAALHAGKLDEARKALEPLVTDASAPQGVRERSVAMMTMVVEQELARAAPPPAPEVKSGPAPAGEAAPGKSGSVPPAGGTPKKK